MYLCICIATHLHTVYLDWLQAVLEKQFEVRLKMMMGWTQGCTPRLWSSELRDALRGCDWASSMVHLEGEIEWTQRCTWRLRLSEIGDAVTARLHVTCPGPGNTSFIYSRLATSLRSLAIILPWYYSTILTSTCATVSTDIPSYEAIHGRMPLQMHMKAVIERVWRYTWRPWSSELRDALRSCDRASVEMHLQAMIERDWRWSIWRWSIWRWSIGGAPGAETVLIS